LIESLDINLSLQHIISVNLMFETETGSFHLPTNLIKVNK